MIKKYDSQQEMTVSDLEATALNRVNLSFEEYQAMKTTAVNAVVNDYAVNMMKKAKADGREMTMEEALEAAKNEIPAAFVPEWMKNLRIGANLAGTEVCYLEAVRKELEDISDLLRCVFETQIDEYANRHANDFKRWEQDKTPAEVVEDGNA